MCRCSVELSEKRSLHETERLDTEFERIISGTPGFIVGSELVQGALDVNGLKELIGRLPTVK